MATHHQLKTWPIFWDAVKDGSKPFEVRKNDRNYQVGDVLHLFRWDPNFPEGTDIKAQPQIVAEVTYVLFGQSAFGMDPEFVVLGLRLPEIPFLTKAQLERLAILAEESAEVIQAAMKIVRHGYDSYHPQHPGRGNNRDMLTDEMGHAAFATAMVHEAGDVNVDKLISAINRKDRSIKPYLHYQGKGHDDTAHKTPDRDAPSGS